MSLDTRLRSVFDTVLELDPKLPDSTLRYQETPGWDSLGAVLLISSIDAPRFALTKGIISAIRVPHFGEQR